MPKIIDHGRYRQQLLQRATAVFVSRGYAEVSMREIATAIEVSTGTLYHYFPSKEDLFCHLFLFHARQSTEQLVDHLCGVSDRQARFDLLLDFFLKHCGGMRVQFLLSADMARHALPPKSAGLLRRWSTALKKELGEILEVDAETQEMLFCFLSGTLYSRVVSGDTTDLAPVFRRFRKIFNEK